MNAHSGSASTTSPRSSKHSRPCRKDSTARPSLRAGAKCIWASCAVKTEAVVPLSSFPGSSTFETTPSESTHSRTLKRRLASSCVSSGGRTGCPLARGNDSSTADCGKRDTASGDTGRAPDRPSAGTGDGAGAGAGGDVLGGALATTCGGCGATSLTSKTVGGLRSSRRPSTRNKTAAWHTSDTAKALRSAGQAWGLKRPVRTALSIAALWIFTAAAGRPSSAVCRSDSDADPPPPYSFEQHTKHDRPCQRNTASPSSK